MAAEVLPPHRRVGIKIDIERALAPLVGLPLLGSTRAADLQMFAFGAYTEGVDARGRRRRAPTYALHVQRAFHLRGRTGIVLASRDRYLPAGDPDAEPPDFEWDAVGANRLDERVFAFFATTAPPVVRSVRADAVGGLLLRMAGGWSLAVFPDDSLGKEHWRFFAPGSKDHLVVTGTGIE
jgi:hypothetical protein